MFKSGGENHIFIDGQNFYLSARQAFDRTFPDYDILQVGNLLSQKISGQDATTISFYSGVPIAKYQPRWAEFWSNKTAAMEEQGIRVTTRPLRYLTESDPQVPNGFRIIQTREKGIDMALGLDVASAARRSNCANIVIVSRDQDFAEVVRYVDDMSKFEKRDIQMWSSFPKGDGTPTHYRGIAGTREIRISQKEYLSCLDDTDYRGRFAPKRAVEVEPEGNLEPSL